jgi:hypothetical protein
MPNVQANHAIAEDLTEAQSALVRATRSLLMAEDVVAGRAMLELLVANEALTRALKLLMSDSLVASSALPTLPSHPREEVTAIIKRSALTNSALAWYAQDDSCPVIAEAAELLVELMNQYGGDPLHVFTLSELRTSKRTISGRHRVSISTESELLRTAGLIEHVERGQVGAGYRLTRLAHEIFHPHITPTAGLGSE